MTVSATSSGVTTVRQRRVGPRSAVWVGLVWLSVAGAASSSALDPDRRLGDYTRAVWNMTNGLPQSSVTAIVQTRDGYLWFGTFDGLARFDGVRFDLINLIRQAGTDSNVVLSMLETKDGSLFVGMRSGLVRYRAGVFASYTTAQGLADNYIWALHEDRSGALWIGTKRGGLSRLQNGRFSTITTADGLPSNDVRAVCEDRAGTIWVGTTGGLARLAGGRPERVSLGSPLGGVQPAGESLDSLLVGHDGTLHVGTASGLVRIGSGAPPLLRTARPFAGVKVLSLATDDRGTIWVGTDAGLGRVTNAGVDTLTARQGLPQGMVRALLVDREGSLWAGTDGGGVQRFTDTSVVMVPVSPTSPPYPVMSIYEDARGALWFGTNDGGLYRRVNGRSERIALGSGPARTAIWSLAGSRDGTLWVGTYGDGICRLKDGHLSTWTTAEGLSSNEIMAIALGRDGAVWIGTHGEGVNRLLNGRVTIVNKKSGLSHGDVRALLEDHEGALWAGTYGGGLNRLKDGAIQVYTRREGLPANNVLALHEDGDHTLWIGTAGGGLGRLKNGAFVRYSTDNGLFDDNVFQILDDEQGHLWMSSNRGLFRADKQELDEVARGARKTLTSASWGTAQGLSGAGVLGGSQPAGWRDHTGRLWFPMMDGAAVIDPARLRSNPVAPIVHVGALLVDRQLVPQTDAYVVGPGSREIEIGYTALSYAAPDKVRFKYRLEGYESDWTEAGTRRTAFFTNIPPGRYTFRVIACNDESVWNLDGASIRIELQPYFYQTRAFFALSVGAGLGLAWALFRLRVRRLEQRGRDLAAQVDVALTDIRVLRGLLPICASCKRIRNDTGSWTQLEGYIRDHSHAEFSHGICPECAERLYPDLVAPAASGASTQSD